MLQGCNSVKTDFDVVHSTNVNAQQRLLLFISLVSVLVLGTLCSVAFSLLGLPHAPTIPPCLAPPGTPRVECRAFHHHSTLN